MDDETIEHPRWVRYVLQVLRATRDAISRKSVQLLALAGAIATGGELFGLWDLTEDQLEWILATSPVVLALVSVTVTSNQRLTGRAIGGVNGADPQEIVEHLVGESSAGRAGEDAD